MMSNVIKDLSVFFLSPMSFKMEWHSSRFDKWYQNYGHEFELRECHCEGEIVGRTIIWLSTTTLKTGLHGVMLNAIKDLSVSTTISWEDHNLTIYNHSKNRPTWCDVECHKRFECIFLITNWFWSRMTQLTVRQIDMLKLSGKKIMTDILLNMSLISCLLYINYYI